MDGTGTIESGADLVADVEANFFDDVTPDTPVVETAPEGGDDNVIETPAELEPETPVVEDEPLPEEELDADGNPIEAAPVTPTIATDELPEGVSKGKDRNGKEGLFVQVPRWETIHGGYKTVQEAAALIGEPITADSLKQGGALWLRNEAYNAQERMFTELNSGDPKQQAKVVDYILGDMVRARESGEIGVDATVPFAQTIYSTLKEKSPDGFANIRLMGARDLVSEMFDAAAKSNDPDLFTSVQHLVRAITAAPKGTDAAGVRAIAERMGLPFYTKAEMPGLAKGPDPVQTLRQRNAELEAQLNGRSTTTQAAQLDEWKAQTWDSMEKGVLEDAVQPALTAVAEAWKPFPDEYKKHVVDALHSKVNEILFADPALKNRINALQNRARLATSAQVRAQLATEIRTAYTNRAKLAADASLRPVLNAANKILTGLSNSTHARRQAAQGRTAPTRGVQGSVQRSMKPPSSSMGIDFDPATAVREGAALFG